MNKYIFLWLFYFPSLLAQKDEPVVLQLTINDVLQLTQQQSPQVEIAKYQFKTAYWQYRSYKVGYLPSLNIATTTPNINRSTNNLTNPDGTNSFVKQNNMQNLVGLSINQAVPFTGGQWALNSNLQRIEVLGNGKSISYLGTPVGISYTQAIAKSNPFKWTRKTEPLRYIEAQRTLITNIEDANIRAINLFFDFALANINIDIQKVNFANADTLYKISKGRFNIGTIAENELLQMELGYLNASTALTQAKMDFEIKQQQLRMFLGFNKKVIFKALLPDSVPINIINFDTALIQAQNNNPNILSYQRQIIEADKAIADAKASRFNANVAASYNLSKTSVNPRQIYVNPEDQQTVNVTMSMPIVSWGLTKGKIKMAQANRQIVETNIKMAMVDFEQNLYNKVIQFNMQGDQLIKASKTDTIAKKSYEISKFRFKIGKISVTDLNIALTAKDGAKQGYISAIRSYWQMYYDIRKTTLYDFEKKQPLIFNFEKDIED